MFWIRNAATLIFGAAIVVTTAEQTVLQDDIQCKLTPHKAKFYAIATIIHFSFLSFWDQGRCQV